MRLACLSQWFFEFTLILKASWILVRMCVTLSFVFVSQTLCRFRVGYCRELDVLGLILLGVPNLTCTEGYDARFIIMPLA